MLFETISHVSVDCYVCWLKSNAPFILLSDIKSSSVSRDNQQEALRHTYSANNTTKQIYYNKSSEHNKAHLLAQIICRSHNSSLLRQLPVNQPFFWIFVYTSAALESSLRSMRSSSGLKLASPVLDYALYLSVFSFHLMTKQLYTSSQKIIHALFSQSGFDCPFLFFIRSTAMSTKVFLQFWKEMKFPWRQSWTIWRMKQDGKIQPLSFVRSGHAKCVA